MAVDPWMIDAAGGAPSYTAGEARLLLVTPFIAGAGASLGVRSGVRPSGSGTDLLVQAQGSPNMSVLVNPGAIIAQGAISVTQGAYTWVLDTATTLVIGAAHATLARTDLVCVRIRDAGVDTSGQRDAAVTVITGTAGAGVPALPTDATYIEIARVAVAANAATIVAGNITDRRPFTAAAGGTIRCTSTTRPGGVEPGQRIYETDTALARIWDGTIWRLDGPLRRQQTLAATTASITFAVPSTLRRIVLNLAARSNRAANMDDIAIRLNGDSTVGSYRWVFRNAFNGSTGGVNNSYSDDKAIVGTVPAATTPVGYFGSTEVRLSPAAGVMSMVPYTANSGFVSDAAYVINDCAGTFWPTGNVSSVTIISATGSSFTANSSCTLWGWE